MAVPTKTETLDDLFTTTWYNMRDHAVDNIFTATPFWYWIFEHKGNVRDEVGGRYIGIPLMYATSSTVEWFDSYGQVDTTPQVALTTGTEVWRYLSGSVARSAIEEQQNSGKNQIFSLVQSKLDQLQLSIIDKLETALFTAQTGSAMNGLPDLVDVTPATGTVHGINAATYTWWQNQQQTFSGSFSVNGLKEFANFYNDCSIGADHPDLLLTTQVVFELYEAEMQQFLQFSTTGNASLGDAGFETLRYKGMDMVWSSNVTTGYAYFLNSKYFELVRDPMFWFEMTEWKPAPEQPDARTAQVVLALNLLTNNRRMHGVLSGIPTS
jgi:hypothetical protein